MEYPTRNGIAIPPSELELPESHLDLRADYSWNNHHMEWERRKYGKHIIYQTLRNLDRLQVVMPVDVHNALHDTYTPPKMPTLKQASDEIMDAWEEMEGIKIYHGKDKGYVERDIPFETIIHIRKYYGDYDD